MKRAAVILLILSLPLTVEAQDYSGLDSLLTRFYKLLAFEPVEEKIAEFDGLISTCRDSLTRQHVALRIFDHYREPELMGDEEVAVHIFDRWFADGILPMTGEMELFEARMFADFNRSTLIGRPAPVVELKGRGGKKIAVPEAGCSAILFFYDTSCSKCRLEVKLLPKVLAGVDFPINFYAVYCGSDKRAWKHFRREFRTGNRNVRVVHLWDPDIDSDYLRLYGVISTPRMYMTEPQGSIIGRRLDPESLVQLLPTAGAIQAVYNQNVGNTGL